ncbi:gag poly [Fusarium circinatum]|uniref:Gag poly n=1 Tax=Fusarium circinatum TaxID=48490 RepID=A0A8H5X433_FUSCI|nr:gag poly [Fusarium circinatum]
MSSNTGPAPPYTGTPPSNAETAAKVQQLRNLVRTLQAQMNNQQNAATGNNGGSKQRGRDLGEALKLPKPEPFKGQATDDNFEQALKDNFGVVNKERQAVAELLALKQQKSYAAHSAKFRQLAAKTQWDDDALMEIYYRSVKEKVKDKLNQD